jgi:hypothetical protein
MLLIYEDETLWERITESERGHLFIASVPVLGAMIVLFLLRHWDRGAINVKDARHALHAAEI